MLRTKDRYLAHARRELASGPTPRAPLPNMQDVHNFVAAQHKMH